jgi:hypothetical protein
MTHNQLASIKVGWIQVLRPNQIGPILRGTEVIYAQKDETTLDLGVAVRKFPG